MADQGDYPVRRDDGCSGGKTKECVCCCAVEDIGEAAAAGEDAVGGGDAGCFLGVMLGSEAGDALLGGFARDLGLFLVLAGGLDGEGGLRV